MESTPSGKQRLKAEDEHYSGRVFKRSVAKVLQSAEEEQRQQDGNIFALRYEKRVTSPYCVSVRLYTTTTTDTNYNNNLEFPRVVHPINCVNI